MDDVMVRFPRPSDRCSPTGTDPRPSRRDSARLRGTPCENPHWSQRRIRVIVVTEWRLTAIQ